jgi:predicted metal-binding membrane protein
MVSTADLARQDRNILLAAAAAVFILSWLVLAFQHTASVARHHSLAAPQALVLAPGGFALAFAMWMVMMVAMMLPPVMPWILLFTAMSRGKGVAQRPIISIGAFMAGYFAIWGVYSLGAALLQMTLQHAGALGAVEIGDGSQVGGALLFAAGLFQFSPLKAACLSHCRTPLNFFLSQWRDGPAGAFSMGSRHGFFCVGCCWVLMGLMFALGVMNLLWMAVLTLIICIEKIAVRGQLLSLVFGVLLASWGMWLMVA